jgi:hypothetical protein
MASAICRMGLGMRRSFSPTRARPSRRPLVSLPVTSISTAVQTICLTAELALKGALASRGWPEPQYRKLSHYLAKLAEAPIGEVSTAHDHRLLGAVAHFPDYVGTRYSSHGMTRTELMVLAMRPVRSSRGIAPCI